MSESSSKFMKQYSHQPHHNRGGENKFMKKSLSLLLAFAMVFSMFASLAFAADELTTQQKYDALKTKGIFAGFPDGSAGLDQMMTRAQFAVIAAKVYDKDFSSPPSTATFSDVPTSHWAFAYVEATTPEFFAGTGDGEFDPEANVTLEAMATVFVKALGLPTPDATVEATSNWAGKFVKAALDAGLIPADVDYTQPAFRSDLVDTSYTVDALVETATALTIKSMEASDSTHVKVTLSDDSTKDLVLDTPLVSGVATVIKFMLSGVEKEGTVTWSDVKTEVASVTPKTNNKVDIGLVNAIVNSTATKSAATLTIKDSAGTALAVSSWSLSADGKTISVMTAAQTPYALYTLTIDGVSYNFVGQVADTAAPTITSAVATTNTKVKVTFSEKVDSAKATNIANYAIAGLSVLKAELNSAGTEVTLTTASQTTGTIYAVVVTNVSDLSGNVVASNSTQFGGLAPDTTAPTVSSAVATTNTKVKVTFNEAMDAASAQTAANYTIAGLTVSSAVYDSTGMYVTLTTTSQAIGTIYAVVVANVKDDSGNVIGTNSTQFGGLAPDTTAPTVSSAVALTNTSVQVTFNEELDSASATTAANYTIAGLTVTAAALDSTLKIVTLTTSPQTVGTIYAVVAANVADTSMNKVGTNSTKFGGLAADTTAPGITSVTSASNTSVTVTFNKAVDAGATTAANYNLGSELGYPTKVTKVSSTVYTLTTKAQAAKVYTATISNVKDLSGNTIAASSTATFAGSAGAPDTAKPTVSSAVAVNINTIMVTFNEAIDTATVGAGDFTISVQSGTETGATPLAGASAAGTITYSNDNKSATLQFAAATMTSGVIYKVTVATVSDVAGNVIDGAANNTALFAGITSANPAPTVSSAIATNNQTIAITFSEAVSVPGTLAGLVAGDFVYSPAYAGTFVNTPTLSADGKTLTLYYTGAVTTPGQIYTVTVNTIRFNDKAGVTALSSTSSGNVGTFAGVSTAATTPKISSVVAINLNTLDITFDQKVTSTLSSGTVGDLTITGLAAVDALIRTEGSDGNKLRVFFNNTVPFVAGTIYTLNVDNTKVTNLNGSAMAAADNNKQFAAISTANAVPSVVSASQASATTVNVVFSEIVAGAAAADFSVTGGSVASMTGNGSSTIVLTLSAPLVTSGIKTGGIVNGTITDEAGVANVAVNAAATTYVSTDATAPTSTVTSAVYDESDNTITVTGTNFNTVNVNTTDIKSIVDWTKFVLDINGDNATTANVTFATADITSAVITSNTVITITLTGTKATALEATAGYDAGGVVTAGADTLDVAAGYVKDAAGNVATTDAVVNGAVTVQP